MRLFNDTKHLQHSLPYHHWGAVSSTCHNKREFPQCSSDTASNIMRMLNMHYRTQNNGWHTILYSA